MFHTTQALVLREVRYKEADRILTLFSAADGKITAKARGALRKSSRTAAATQQLTYAEMTLFGNRGKWTVNEASLIEAFTGLRKDIERFSLGSYFAECMEAFSAEDQPDPAMLQLGLNCLYALSQGMLEPLLVKAAFEIRLMAIAGYEPDLHGCSVCGKEAVEEPILCLEDGGVCCRACKKAVPGAGVPLDEPYLEEKVLGGCDLELPYQVPDGRIFVMGDHRATSIDSRNTLVGCVSSEQLLGRVVLRFWPLSRFGPIQ